VWANCAAGSETVDVDGVAVSMSPTFKMAGITFGEDHRAADKMHFAPREQRARAAADRIIALAAPMDVAAALWRTFVLAQLVYGCTARSLPGKMLADMGIPLPP